MLWDMVGQMGYSAPFPSKEGEIGGIGHMRISSLELQYTYFYENPSIRHKSHLINYFGQ